MSLISQLRSLAALLLLTLKVYFISLKAAWTSFQQEPESSVPGNTLSRETEAPSPDQTEQTQNTEPSPEFTPSANPVLDLAPARCAAEAVKDACSVPAPDPTESAAQGDSATLGKKKKGFFSKGKRLFKKLGSSKKD